VFPVNVSGKQELISLGIFFMRRAEHGTHVPLGLMWKCNLSSASVGLSAQRMARLIAAELTARLLCMYNWKAKKMKRSRFGEQQSYYLLAR
jgi:hypothetical protein